MDLGYSPCSSVACSTCGLSWANSSLWLQLPLANISCSGLSTIFKSIATQASPSKILELPPEILFHAWSPVPLHITSPQWLSRTFHNTVTLESYMLAKSVVNSAAGSSCSLAPSHISCGSLRVPRWLNLIKQLPGWLSWCRLPSSFPIMESCTQRAIPIAVESWKVLSRLCYSL